MVNKLICSIQNGIKKIALLENNELAELYIFNTEKLANSDIVIGRISEKNDNIKAFFVEIGKNQSGFFPMPKNKKHNVGDILPFEVVKIAKGNKHPKITSQISLAGAFCVYTPFGEGYNVAKSITDEKERERLEYIGMDIVPLISGGITIRSAAIGISEDTIRREIDFLKAKWQKIESQRTVGLNIKGLDPAIFFLAKHKDNLKEVISDDADFLGAIKNWGKQIEISEEVFSFYPVNKDLFSDLNLDENLDLLLEKEVYIPGGAKITIEPTAALVAIDIDSGSNHDDIFKINLEAAKEALKQIRLRNLSGQIVIDLIKDRRNPDISQKIAKALYEVAAKDSVKTRIIGVTPLGNIEITRERRFLSLYEVMDDK